MRSADKDARTRRARIATTEDTATRSFLLFVEAFASSVSSVLKAFVMSDTSIKDFEGAIAELESIVKKLEEGDLPLEQSLALYERGVQLSRFCHARLEEAERRIEILTERGELKPAPATLTSDDPDRR